MSIVSREIPVMLWATLGMILLGGVTRQRGQPDLAARHVARADPPLPRPADVAAADALGRRPLPGRARGEAAAGPPRPPPPGADAFNRELAERIQRDGRIFLSSTLIGGRVTLRLAVLNVHVHLEHIERAIAVVAELAERLRSDPAPTRSPPDPT